MADQPDFGQLDGRSSLFAFNEARTWREDGAAAAVGAD
jgi:hypothetical protein